MRRLRFLDGVKNWRPLIADANAMSGITSHCSFWEPRKSSLEN